MFDTCLLLVAPHHDDVALSCGATASLARTHGHTAVIVTLFASEVVHSMVGEFAASKHERWGVKNPEAVSELRRNEDAAAAAVLGCATRWLGLPDAIYRGERYSRDGALYGKVHDDEQAFSEVVAAELLHLPEWKQGLTVAVPLGIGSHVDHQIAFGAGRLLARQGINVVAYEDLPYSIHSPHALEQRLADVADAVGHAILLDVENGMTAKVQAISCYGSQVPVIFRFTDDWQRAIWAHATRIGNGRACERFWPVLS